MADCKHMVDPKAYFKAGGKGEMICSLCGAKVTAAPEEHARLNRTADILSIVLSLLAGLMAVGLGWLLVSNRVFGKSWAVYFVAAILAVAVLMGVILLADGAFRSWYCRNKIAFRPAETDLAE